MERLMLRPTKSNVLNEAKAARKPGHCICCDRRIDLPPRPQGRLLCGRPECRRHYVKLYGAGRTASGKDPFARVTQRLWDIEARAAELVRMARQLSAELRGGR